MTEQVALTILPLDLGRNLRRPPQKSRSSTRLGPQAVMPRPAREPHSPPELGHEPLVAASPGLLSTRDGLVPLVQLGLEVVDVALDSKQLILRVLQSGTGVIEVVSLEVTATISPHQLITPLSDACL
jgi:hypothetical protein